jgi:TRAP-type C4-dicarboxylate transport system substrate-binding protein
MSRDAPEYANILPVGVVDDIQKLPKLRSVLWDIEEETYKKWGIKLLSVVQLPLAEMQVICKQPVSSLEELKSKKLRVFAKFHVDAFAALGVSAQVIPQSDLYIALQTGVVDCAYYPIAYASTISLQEVAPYASYIGTDIPAPGNLVASKKAWDALPPDLQKVVQSAADRIEKETWDYLVSGVFDKEGAEKFVRGGGKVLAPFSKEDQAKFVETCLRVWRQVNESTGPVALRNYERVRAALEAK